MPHHHSPAEKKHKAYFSVCLHKHLHWEKIKLETHSPEQDQAPRSYSNCVSPCKWYHCLTANNCFKLSRTFPTALSYRVTWQAEPPERKIHFRLKKVPFDVQLINAEKDKALNISSFHNQKSFCSLFLFICNYSLFVTSLLRVNSN